MTRNDVLDFETPHLGEALEPDLKIGLPRIGVVVVEEGIAGDEYTRTRHENPRAARHVAG